MKALRRSNTSASSSSPSSSSSPPPSSSWIHLRSLLVVASSSSSSSSTSSSSSSSSSVPSPLPDRGSLKSPWSRRKRKRALSRRQWYCLFSVDGRLRDGGAKFLKKVRSGGVDPSIRAEVWPFLLGVERSEVIQCYQHCTCFTWIACHRRAREFSQVWTAVVVVRSRMLRKVSIIT